MLEHIAIIVGAVAATIAAIVSNQGRKHASETNDAVNHRHRTGTPRLYDMVLQNSVDTREVVEWKRGYEGGPLDDGDKVVAMMEDFEQMKQNCAHGCFFKDQAEKDQCDE